MRVLVIYCHPCPESFNAALRDTTLNALAKAGHDVRLHDLYAENFNPVMSADERRGYHTPGDNEIPARREIDDFMWCEALVFVYPTWWFGLPAMLKGWLDRCWVPHVTFEMPSEAGPMKPRMQHIRKLAVITTCGASWWISKLMGEPGRKTIMRGIRALCAPRCRTTYLAHYKMDTSTPASRKAYLEKVRRKLEKL